MKIFTSSIILLSILLLGNNSLKRSSEFEPMINEPVFELDDISIDNNVRGMQIVANLALDSAEDLLALVDRAKAKGANTIFFADSKTNIFGINGTAGAKWDQEMKAFSDGVKARDMDLIFMTTVMGFCGSLIGDNPDLTTGYPIKNQELRAENGELVPVNSSELFNGDFEDYSGNLVTDWGFQDAPGSRTFIDTQVKRSGQASFRAEGKGGESSRIFTTFKVVPFHQYTLRFWVKTENLTADNLLALIRDEDNHDRELTSLQLSTTRKDDGGRSYFKSPNQFTLDWTEVRIAFNSLEATRVNLALAVYGGTTGKIWWDDVEILDTPALNWLNRDDLPKSVQFQNGSPLDFGVDVAVPLDTKLGFSGYPGDFDTQHAPPKIQIINSGKIKEGDIVTINGYHGLPTAAGQVSCSWNNPETYERMRQVHQSLQDTYQPDGFLLNYSEIRTGGWEPADADNFTTSGAALAQSIKVAFEDLFEIAPDGQFYFWSDMVDPNHNANAFYYQVKNTLDQSWLTLNADKVTIANWWETVDIPKKAAASLQFFSDKEFKQIVGAFYDSDVNVNYDRWQQAAEGIEGIVGNMYATWTADGDFTKIEPYGDLWWVRKEVQNQIVSLSAPKEVTPRETYSIEVVHEAEAASDIVVILQLNESPWTNYGSARVPVVSGSKTVTLDFQVNEDIPLAEGAYKWTAFSTPSGLDWEEQTGIVIQAGVSCIPEQVFEDSLTNLIVPAQVSPGESYTINVAYSASETRRMVAYLQLNMPPWSDYGYQSFEVQSGADKATLEMTMPDSLPTGVADYKWVTYLTPLGGNWVNNVALLEKTGIDVLATSALRTSVQNLNGLTMYPNPAGTTVTFESDLELQAFDIYSNEGRLLKQLTANKESAIDVSDLTNGIYIVVTTLSNGKKLSGQLIVQH
ncbi:T9SS type A sorting domain-containing protein [Maribacter sp. 2-571]|uniref:T9SS type A sorting domain-containing protein n=1 Tax=Maribacter sp. 2-571 TaxID=3417569 RepID=UPI003D33E28F